MLFKSLTSILQMYCNVLRSLQGNIYSSIFMDIGNIVILSSLSIRVNILYNYKERKLISIPNKIHNRSYGSS